MATAFERAAEAPRRAPPALLDGLLAGLTPEQTQAVCHGPGVLLIVAGPGAGKTKTLIHRIAWLLAQGLAEPHEILAVTFSVRAASELRLRLAELLGEQTAAQVSAATFHSICARLLRDHAQLFGRSANWTVYDQVEVRKVVDWLLSDRQRTAIQQALADFGQPASSEVLHEISLAKNRLLTPESYEQARAASGRAADRRRVARNRGGAAALKRDGLRRPAGVRRQAAGRAPAPPGALPPPLAVDPGRRVPGHLPGAGRTGLPARDRGRKPGRRRRRRSGLVLVPRRRRARAGQARRTVPKPRADRARAQLPLPRRNPVGGRPVDPAQPRPGAQDADRDARARRTGAGARVLLRARGGLLDRGDRGPGASGGDPADRDPAAGADRIRERPGTDRARGRRHPPPGARVARPLRALGGTRRARLPDPDRQPGRRTGVPARRRRPPPRGRGANRRTGGGPGPRGARRGPDRRQRQRDAERDRHAQRRASNSNGSAAASRGPAQSSRRDARSGT